MLQHSPVDVSPPLLSAPDCCWLLLRAIQDDRPRARSDTLLRLLAAITRTIPSNPSITVARYFVRHSRTLYLGHALGLARE